MKVSNVSGVSVDVCASYIKPGTEMFVSDTLSRAIINNALPSSRHVEHTVCSTVDKQLAIEHINIA